MHFYEWVGIGGFSWQKPKKNYYLTINLMFYFYNFDFRIIFNCCFFIQYLLYNVYKYIINNSLIKLLNSRINFYNIKLPSSDYILKMLQ